MDLYSLYATGILVGQAAALLSLIIAGIKFVFSMGAPERIQDAKDQFVASLLGLFIVTFLPAILHLVNPDLPGIREIFTMPFKKVKFPPVELEPLTKTSGVYVTAEGKEHILTISTSNLGTELDNKITAIRVVGNYGYILFDEADYKGECDAASPDFDISRTSSILIYSSSPVSGSGKVTFYRKAFYSDDMYWSPKGKKTGGKFEFEITDYSWLFLENCEFEDVPEDEKKCIEWDNNGKCTKRETPTLAGDGISSIKITRGDISLLLISDGMVEKERGNYFCQLFWDKVSTYSVANLKNEYIRAKERYPIGAGFYPGTP